MRVSGNQTGNWIKGNIKLKGWTIRKKNPLVVPFLAHHTLKMHWRRKAKYVSSEMVALHRFPQNDYALLTQGRGHKICTH